jgi:hypothetical protein
LVVAKSIEYSSDTLENKMGRLGRRKLPEQQRRTAGALNVRFNVEEWATVVQKAADAGVTPTEWARVATLGRNPPPCREVPEVNEQAWRELGRLAATLNAVMWRFRPGLEDGLRELFDVVRKELHQVRMALKGAAE